MALTDTAIRASKPRTRPYKVYDRDGLYLLVNPSGSKLWRWRYQFEGEKLMALGEYPLVGLSEVRERHFAKHKRLASGIDPMAQRKAEAEGRRKELEDQRRQSDRSFEKVARLWWDRWAIGKSARHAATVLRRLETDVFPVIGSIFIDDVGSRHIRDIMLTIEKRDARDVAKRAHESVGQIFRFAIVRDIVIWGWRFRSPRWT